MESYKKGTFWERVLAFLIDQLIVLLFVGGIIFLFLQPKSTVLNIILSLVLISYGTFFLWQSGSTPGKKVLRLKVVDTNYEAVTLKRALLRESIGKFASNLVFNLGYFWVLINPKRQAWHDRIAKTYVVKTNKSGEIIPLEKKEKEYVTKRQRITFGVGYFVFAIPLFLSTTILIIYTYLAQPFQISGGAMAPNYTQGEFYLANKFVYFFSKPVRGDVIVFKAPNDPSRTYIKRIVGMPEETIALVNGKVFINGKEVDEKKYLPDGSRTGGDVFLQPNTQLIIPANHYFVLGDNRIESSDSRQWGLVPKQNIIGEIQFCYNNCGAN